MTKNAARIMALLAIAAGGAALLLALHKGGRAPAPPPRTPAPVSSRKAPGPPPWAAPPAASSKAAPRPSEIGSASRAPEAAAEADLEPGKAYILGRLVDPAGAPCAGAKVSSGSVAGISSGAEGAFRLGPLDPGPAIEVAVAAPGFLEDRFEVAAPEPGEYDVGTIRLSAGAVIAGRVVHAGGAPAAGAKVRAERVGGAAGEAIEAGEDGRFRLAGLRPGRTVVSATFSSLSDEESAAREVTIDGPAAAVAMEDLVLGPAWTPPEVALRGTVRTPGGEPVAYAHVKAFVWNEPSQLQAMTNEQGRFELGLPPGRYVPFVEEEGFAPYTGRPIELEPGRPATVEIVLGAGGTVAGRCEGACADTEVDDLPARVEFDPRDGSGVMLHTMIGNDGTFRMEHIAPGAYRARALPLPGWPPMGAQDVTVREGEVTEVVFGPVRTGATKVRVIGLSAAELSAATLAVFDAGFLLADAHLHDDGSAECSLPDGAFTVHIAAGGVTFDRAVTVEAGRPLEIALPSERARLSGRLAGLLAVCNPVSAAGGAATAGATAEADGTFRFPSLPPGTYRVTSPGFVPQEVSLGAGDNVGIVLEQYGAR